MILRVSDVTTTGSRFGGAPTVSVTGELIGSREDLRELASAIDSRELHVSTTAPIAPPAPDSFDIRMAAMQLRVEKVISDHMDFARAVGGKMAMLEASRDDLRYQLEVCQTLIGLLQGDVDRLKPKPLLGDGLPDLEPVISEAGAFS